MSVAGMSVRSRANYALHVLPAVVRALETLAR